MRWLLPVLIAVSVCHAGDHDTRSTAPQESPVRVLVAVGGHTEAPSFFSLFDGYPEISAQVTQRPEAFANDFRKKYDVVVLYDMLSDLSEPERKHLKEFVESGKGVVSLHWAVLDYDAWPWWHEEVVGGKFIRPVNGEKCGSCWRRTIRTATARWPGSALTKNRRSYTSKPVMPQAHTRIPATGNWCGTLCCGPRENCNKSGES
jgi:hypothetical protein